MFSSTHHKWSLSGFSSSVMMADTTHSALPISLPWREGGGGGGGGGREREGGGGMGGRERGGGEWEGERECPLFEVPLHTYHINTVFAWEKVIM